SRRRHTRSKRDWSSDVCSSDLIVSKTGSQLSSYFPSRKKRSNKPNVVLLISTTSASDASERILISLPDAIVNSILGVESGKLFSSVTEIYSVLSLSIPFKSVGVNSTELLASSLHANLRTSFGCFLSDRPLGVMISLSSKPVNPLFNSSDLLKCLID